LIKINAGGRSFLQSIAGILGDIAAALVGQPGLRNRDEGARSGYSRSECGVLLSELAVSVFARRSWVGLVAAPLVRVGLVAASLGAVIGHGVAVGMGLALALAAGLAYTQQQRPATTIRGGGGGKASPDYGGYYSYW
jgi:hypothetical protein